MSIPLVLAHLSNQISAVCPSNIDETIRQPRRVSILRLVYNIVKRAMWRQEGAAVLYASGIAGLLLTPAVHSLFEVLSLTHMIQTGVARDAPLEFAAAFCGSVVVTVLMFEVAPGMTNAAADKRQVGSDLRTLHKMILALAVWSASLLLIWLGSKMPTICWALTALALIPLVDRRESN
jgi:hypothetical protein